MNEQLGNSTINGDAVEPLPGQGWQALLLLGVACMTAWLLLYPFDFVAQKQTEWLAERQIHKLNTLSNIMLFVPCGMMGAWVLKRWWPRMGFGIIVMVGIDSGLFSLAGETVQMWLPGRQSSLIDLSANTAGGVVGAMIGLTLAPRLTSNWRRTAAWLSVRVRARRALFVLLILLAARTAPFDASPETFYLKESLFYQTKQAGTPFAKTRAWLAGDSGRTETAGLVDRRAEAITELKRAGLNLLLFTLAAAALLRAARENRMLTGRDGRGVGGVLVLCIGLVIATELAQWPIRSRLMDMTDPVAGIAGVIVGLLIASAAGPPRLTAR